MKLHSIPESQMNAAWRHHSFIENKDRPDWDMYFLFVAATVAARADCSKAKHGAVIVKNHRIVSTGYNGSPAGSDQSCLAGDCPRALAGTKSLSGYDNCISIHAEANALLYASREGTEGADLYITGEPCQWCCTLMSGAGIYRCVYVKRDA